MRVSTTNLNWWAEFLNHQQYLRLLAEQQKHIQLLQVVTCGLIPQTKLVTSLKRRLNSKVTYGSFFEVTLLEPNIAVFERRWSCERLGQQSGNWKLVEVMTDVFSLLGGRGWGYRTLVRLCWKTASLLFHCNLFMFNIRISSGGVIFSVCFSVPLIPFLTFGVCMPREWKWLAFLITPSAKVWRKIPGKACPRMNFFARLLRSTFAHEHP